MISDGSPAFQGHKFRGAGCRLVYLDIGSNKGDSIEDFASNSSKMDGFLVHLLQRNVPWWRPETTCVQGFEPNPRWTERLTQLEANLTASKALRALHIHTELAVTGDRPPRPLRLARSHRDGNDVKASVAVGSRFGVEIASANFADWVRSFALALDEPDVPIVVRLDIEGSEYGLLLDLATSGLTRFIANPVLVGLEWHRFLKESAMRARLGALSELDFSFAHFNRAALPKLLNRSRARTIQAADELSMGRLKLVASSLEQNQEKILVYMLKAANITTPA